MPFWSITRITTEANMNSMFNPPHPGLTLRDDILPALELQVGEAAIQLGVDRTTLSKVLNGRAAISPAMALRIERWLGRDHGGAAEVWLKCGWHNRRHTTCGKPGRRSKQRRHSLASKC